MAEERPTSRWQTRAIPARRDPAGSTTPSRVALYQEQASAIRTALESLPDDVRDIVRLRLLEQLSLEQVAERLTTTVPTVRYRFARGLELYRENLRTYFSTRALAAARAPSADRDSNSSSL